MFNTNSYIKASLLRLFCFVDYNMKKIIYILVISFLVSQNTNNQELKNNQTTGYYLYKLYIDESNNITLDNLKYVDMKLKQSQLNRDIHHPIIFKIKNIGGDILYENKFLNPKLIYYENILNENPSKTIIELNNTFFTLKTPVFQDASKIEFYQLIIENHNRTISKISEIIIDVK